MNFRIADTFTDSLARLTGNEQKAAKITAFDLQLNPANPGMQFHKLSGARDPKFWSVRVSRDIRLIVHRTANSLLLCHVSHHDKAYQWAERRKLETHPRTGAAQLVEIRETVQEILAPNYSVAEHLVPYQVTDEPSQPAQPALFEHVADEKLLGFGVPVDWLVAVRQADEDSLLQIAEHLPGEAAEALLELAIGGQPQIPAAVSSDTDPFEHPDAQRRFRSVADADELERALEFSWEKWTVFLHPLQRQIVEKDYNGPVRVSGSAGTGKTIVALHRAVWLARSYPETRILLTTFSDVLAKALRDKLHRLISNQPRLAERLEVHAIDAIGERLYETHAGTPKIASRASIRKLLNTASSRVQDFKFSTQFLLKEWDEVVDAWQLRTWEEYQAVRRLGRKTRLPEQQRAVLWTVFEQAQRALRDEKSVTRAEMFGLLAEQLRTRRNPLFDFVIVDEAQDLSAPQLRFLATLGGDRPNGLFFAGDLGQRIFQTPFSWKSLGVDIRGRSQTLRINYRTSHQIRMQADRLLEPQVADVDGNVEDRRSTVSVFNGPRPDIRVFETSEQEVEAAGAWLAERMKAGVEPHEIGIFVRAEAQLDRARSAAERSGAPFRVLDEQIETATGQLSISTMHLAKGLEFRAVAVMACDDEVIPLQERMEEAADTADLEEVYDTERHLLYVACTRARDHLLVTSMDPASEFLDDLQV